MAELCVYNTLSRSKEPFAPLDDRKVNMFVCGQTVYDDAHLGHAKNYINFDVIARWLRHLGYSVTYLQNITDVDDKIINRAKEANEDPFELARRYEERFMQDMKSIGVTESVSRYPRSLDFIEDIRQQIQLLIDRGYAYYLDGDIYFDVAKFKDYTKLSGMRLDELEKHRIEPKEGKRNTYDFALWKNSKPDEPSWKITVKDKGKEITLNGRPGWHIEDTAITYHFFGAQYDLHGGATELIFPHHTNEIAQAEAAFGKKPFVKYWLHAGIMRIKGEKMSKSLRNFIRIRELLKTYDAEALRLFVCSSQYTKDIEYSDDLMKSAQKRLNYMYSSLGLFYNSETSREGSNSQLAKMITKELEAKFSEAMNDDFNTPLALAALSTAVDDLRSLVSEEGAVSPEEKEDAINEVTKFAGILGILKSDRYKEKISKEAIALINERETLRRSKDFKKADAVREQLKKDYKIIVEDSPYGPLWYKES